ncbi:vWA domain-containing protein [Deinococcus hopiensis]|uniref:Predicted metal-dependent peptidase n=1 Tax=Deinococcus hopiensis KR-140 TaxID=695939 RepID=A0A1W1UTX6_9DEIO|nr:VWA-like domain-containing protein [Deinococcus hopiensis]SMB84500.1 Predicted metal-dependent peptidase [Deinococcus hopiensis KR-140]
MTVHPAEAAFEGLVAASRRRLAGRSPFFATLTLHAEILPSWSVARAATDGHRVYIHPELAATLPAAELDALLLHQVLHLALEHGPRRGGRDAKRWNRAADIVVHGLVANAGLPVTGRSLLLEGRRVEDVYAALEHRPEESVTETDDLIGDPPSNTPREGNGRGTGSGVPWARVRALARAAKALGGGGGEGGLGLQRELDGLEIAQLDWKARLWRFLVRSPVDFGGFDRRFIGRRLYLEALEEDALRLVVVVDTSGSVTNSCLRTLLTEVRGITGVYPHLHASLYYADAEVHGPHDLSGSTPFPPPKGGGGSDFRPALAAAAQGTELIVYLTDGYGRFPPEAPHAPVVWVVPDGGAPDDLFPFGEVLRLGPPT